MNARCRLLGFFCGIVSLVSVLMADGLRSNMTTTEVEMAVGRPTSQLSRGDRTIWNYPEGAQVIFEGGRVVSFKNLPEATAAEVEAAGATADAAIGEAQAGVQSRAQGGAQTAGEAVANMEEALSENAAKAMAEVSDAVEKLEALHQQGPRAIKEAMMPKPIGFQWGGFIVQMVFSLILSVVVLKLAFKWSDIHADWKQMFVPALVNVLTATAVVVVAQLVIKTNNVFYLDHALSYFALVMVLQRTTHASSLSRAVAVAGVTKVASIVLLSILSVFLF